MKQIIININLYYLKIVLIVYLSFNLLGTICGIGESISNVNYPEYDSCLKPKTRVGYIFPGFKLGCFLGSPIEKNEKI